MKREVIITNGKTVFNLTELGRRLKDGENVREYINEIMGILVRRDTLFTGKVVEY